jgi:hypothetical protein
MSRGLGKIQLEVRDFFRRRPYAAITAEELCKRVHRLYQAPTRAQMVGLVRAAKRLAAIYPIGYMEAARRGGTLVFYRSDNKVSLKRAEWLCELGNRDVQSTRLPWSSAPAKPEPQKTGWWRATAAPGAVAAAYKLLLRRGEEPTAEALTRFFKGVPFQEGPVEVILSDLHSRGHLDRIREEVAADASQLE